MGRPGRRGRRARARRRRRRRRRATRSVSRRCAAALGVDVDGVARRRRSRRWRARSRMPARRARSWSPPTSSGRSRRPRRTSSAPTPGGPPSLWARHRQQVGAEVVEGDRARGRRPGRRRRARARRARGTRRRPRRPAGACRPRGCPTARARARCRSRTAASSSSGSTRPMAVDADDGDLAVRARRCGRTAECSTAASTWCAPALGRAPARGGDRLGGPAGEHDLAAAGAEQRGHRLAGLLDGDPRRRAPRRGRGPGSPGRLAQPPRHRLDDLGPRRRRRRVVEVVRAVTSLDRGDADVVAARRPTPRWPASSRRRARRASPAPCRGRRRRSPGARWRRRRTGSAR